MSIAKFMPKRFSRLLNVQRNGLQPSNVQLEPSNANDIALTVIENKNVDKSSTSQNVNIQIVKQVLIQKYDNLYGNQLTTIDDCENIANFLEFFQSSSFDKILKESEKVSVIKFEINEHFCDLSSSDLTGLSTICSKKSIVVFLASKNDQKFLIYWKSKDIEHFLRFKSYNSAFMETNRILYEYVAYFLSKSLIQKHLGIRNASSIKRETTEFELHFLADHREYNVLLAAADMGDAVIVEILLKLGIETESPFKDINAQSLSYNGRHFDVLLLLLKYNLRYPVSMDINQCSIEVQNFVKMCSNLHKHIEANNRVEVNEIVSKNSHLRYFYNKNNNSAAATALRSNSLDIYEDLMMKEIYFGPHENTEAVMEELEPQVQRSVRELHFKHSKDLPESHINILMANSYVGHDVSNVKEKLNLVQQAFNILNSYALIRIILMVVAASRKFRIIFDFNRDNIHVADPTANAYTNGIFYVSGRIYIGARELLNKVTQNEALGTLAHELCHYALNLTYSNDAKPYKPNDNQTMQEFEKISKKCEKNSEIEEVVDLVYDAYPPESYHAELAVRVPHLMALYHGQPDKLQESQKNFPELFDFIEEKIGPEMEKALPDIESKVDKEIEKKISKLKRNFYISVILGIVVAVFVGLYFYEPIYKFDELSEKDRNSVKNRIVNYKNVNVKLGDLFPGNSTIYNNLTSVHISKLLNNDELKFSDPHLHYLERQVYFKWENLTEKLKHKFLNLNLNFQGENVNFQKINSTCSQAFHDLSTNQIIAVLGESEFAIGKKLQSEVDFYIERKFIPEDFRMIDFEYTYGHDFIFNIHTVLEHIRNRKGNKSFENFFDEFFKQDFDTRNEIYNKIERNVGFREYIPDANDMEFRFMHKNFREIIEEIEKEKMFILSSEAGAGKTVTFEQLAIEIKKKFPTRWVSYIDLKGYTELYNTNRSSENIEMLLKDILVINLGKNKFEVRIFEESYKSGTVVLVWNGFDEISPIYNEFILNLIKSIRDHTENVQLVCTRPLYSKQLRQSFKIRTWQLIPFDEGTKRKFLTEYFISKNVSNEQIIGNIENVQKIIQKLNFEGEKYYYKFETPLMLKLVAEIHEDGNLLKSGDIYGIYETFVEKKIKIWFDKSKTAQKIAQKILLGGNLKKFFQKYALLNELRLFSGRLGFKMRKLQIMQKDIPKGLSYAEISSMGILYINGKNEFEFAHKTFAEFFVAQYFIENIYEIDGDVNNGEAELRLELFCRATKTYGYTQQILTDFMTSFVQSRDEDEDEDFNPTISELFRTKFRNFFIRMLDINHPKVFEFLFSFFKKDHDLLVDLLHVNEDETLYTAIFNPNHFALFTDPKDIKRLAQNYLSGEELEKFMNGKNQKGKILYGMLFYDSIGISKIHEDYVAEIKQFTDYFLFDNFRQILAKISKDEQNQLFLTALNPKVFMFYDQIFSEQEFFEYEQLWSIYQNFSTSDELQDAFGDALNSYLEMYIQGHVLDISTLLEIAEEFLSSSQIYKMFLNKNILHKAHWDYENFEALWNFLHNHTNEEQRREILLQDDLSDKNLYIYLLPGDEKTVYSGHAYPYVYYDFTPLKIFHKTLTTFTAPTFELTSQIYQKHFNTTLIQEIILTSNDFIYYVIEKVISEPCNEFVLYLEDLFKGNEKELKNFFERKVKPTKLSAFELVESFRGLSSSQPIWFDNLKYFTDLYEKIKDSGA